MLLAIDDGTAAVLVAAITGTFGLLTALLVQQRKTYREVRQVNRAVNHVAPGEPTLVERVQRLERRSDVQTRWLGDVLTLLAAQLGVKLPPAPREEDEAA